MRTSHTFSRRQNRRRRGFSLLEVVVAVTIVAILAAIVAPRFLNFIGTAKSKRAKAEATQLAQIVKLYLTNNGLASLPDSFELVWLTEGSDKPLDNKKDLIDPWGNEYVIVVPGTDGRDFDIVSFGADGTSGGDGENTDIVHGNA